MKRLQTPLLSWSGRLSIFAGASDSPETLNDLKEHAWREMQEIKATCRNKSLTFEYHGETIRGKFVDVVEGDFPGTFMVVLRLASSRICSGPCFLRLHGRQVGGIVVTGEHGLVGVTAKASLPASTRRDYSVHHALTP